MIASSPLVHVARHAPSAIEFKVFRLLSKFLPNFVYKTPVQDQVRKPLTSFVNLKANIVQDLSHDPSVGEMSLKDPLIKGMGRLEGLVDMISRVRAYPSILACT